MAEVILTAQARKGLDDLPIVVHRRVMTVLSRLERWPDVSGAKPLRRSLAGRFRMRTGDYRVQFFVRGDVVVVEKIGYRGGFYED